MENLAGGLHGKDSAFHTQMSTPKSEGGDLQDGHLVVRAVSQGTACFSSEHSLHPTALLWIPLGVKYCVPGCGREESS